VTIALKQVSEAPVPPSHLNPAVPPALEAVIGRALEKEPEARFADADDFIAALEAARAGTGPIDVGATTAFAPLEEPLAAAGGKPKWWLWGLLTALLVAAAVIAAVLLTQKDQRPVPDVVGADVAAAARRLRNDGFKPVVERVRNSEARDIVIAQDPGPKSRLEVGDDVTLTVSDGPGTRAVPDVEGLTRKAARERLDRAGFKARDRSETSEDVPKGHVIRTSPPIASQLDIGATVTLVISSGPEEVRVPNLVDTDVDDARDRLEQLGLRSEVRREESEDKEPGTVLEQDPKAGATIAAGTEVTLVVAEEPESVEVPDVTGRTESEAVSALSAVGLEAEVKEQVVRRPSQDGEVLSQSPGDGQRLDRGRRVSITVGRFEPEEGTGDDDTSTQPEDDGGTSTTETQPGTTTGTTTGTALAPTEGE
jgi:eukaryotic-like serine/threonine-protein kinase